MAGIPNPEPPVVKSLSQISEYLYSTETALLRDELTVYEAAREIFHARQALEDHIAAPHDTPGEGTEREEGTQ